MSKFWDKFSFFKVLPLSHLTKRLCLTKLYVKWRHMWYSAKCFLTPLYTTIYLQYKEYFQFMFTFIFDFTSTFSPAPRPLLYKAYFHQSSVQPSYYFFLVGGNVLWEGNLFPTYFLSCFFIWPLLYSDIGIHKYQLCAWRSHNSLVKGPCSDSVLREATREQT